MSLIAQLLSSHRVRDVGDTRHGSVACNARCGRNRGVRVQRSSQTMPCRPRRIAWRAISGPVPTGRRLATTGIGTSRAMNSTRSSPALLPCCPAALLPCCPAAPSRGAGRGRPRSPHWRCCAALEWWAPTRPASGSRDRPALMDCSDASTPSCIAPPPAPWWCATSWAMTPVRPECPRRSVGHARGRRLGRGMGGEDRGFHRRARLWAPSR